MIAVRWLLFLPVGLLSGFTAGAFMNLIRLFAAASVILAILLQEVSRGKVIYRIIYYLPAVITGVIVIYLWKLLFDPSDAGGLNQILLSLGLEKRAWLRDESLAMLCCAAP